jgi:hypothetical protein
MMRSWYGTGDPYVTGNCPIFDVWNDWLKPGGAVCEDCFVTGNHYIGMRCEQSGAIQLGATAGGEARRITISDNVFTKCAGSVVSAMPVAVHRLRSRVQDGRVSDILITKNTIVNHIGQGLIREGDSNGEPNMPPFDIRGSSTGLGYVGKVSILANRCSESAFLPIERFRNLTWASVVRLNDHVLGSVVQEAGVLPVTHGIYITDANPRSNRVIGTPFLASMEPGSGYGRGRSPSIEAYGNRRHRPEKVERQRRQRS